MTFEQLPLIHIGYPKALSSWMQKLLFIPDNGFCTVLDPLTVQLGLIDASPFAFDTRQAQQWMEEAWSKAQGDRNNLVPVITSESLVGHTHCGGYNAKNNADRLKQLCPEAKILIVVREQRAEIRSLYKTFVIWGMPHSIRRILRPVEPNLSPQFNFDFLCYDKLVDYYQQLYGKDRVLVLPYELFKVDNQDFLQRLFDFSGIENAAETIGKLPVKRTMNRNQTMVNLLIQRWKNYFLLSNPFNYSGLFESNEERLKQRIVRSKKNPFPAFMDNWFEAGFAHEVEQACSGQFCQSNQRLEALTGLELGAYGYQL